GISHDADRSACRDERSARRTTSTLRQKRGSWQGKHSICFPPDFFCGQGRRSHQWVEMGCCIVLSNRPELINLSPSRGRESDCRWLRRLWPKRRLRKAAD